MLSSYTYSILYSPMSRALMTALLFLAMVSLGWGQVVDEYRTRQSGNWNANTTWERYNGTIWQNLTGTSPLVPPNSGDNIITIRSTHTVTVTTSVTVDQVVVAAGGQVTINSGNTLTINNGTGTDLSVSGTIQTNSTSNNAGFTNNGTIVFNDGGTYIHNVNGETIPTATWDANSNCNITGVTVDVPGGLTPVNGFGNFTWNTIGVNNLSLGGTLNTINGDFTIMSTGTGSISLGGTASGNLTVGGNFVQIGGTFKGNFSQGDGANRTLTINGNFSLSGGTFDFSGATNNFSLSVYLAGNFSHTNGTLTESGNGTANYIYFNGTSMQTYTSGGTVSNTINFTVNSGAYLQMAAAGTIVTGGGTFTLQSGGTLGITNAYGITTGTGTGSTAGNIRTSGGRTFSTGANYIYNGTASQTTGNGLPSIVNNLIIDNPGNVVSLSNATTTTTALNINAGTFRLTTANLLGTGRVNLNGGTFSTGATSGYTETTGILDLTENSTIAFGTESHSLTFANSSGESWAPGKTLTITGWTGNYNGTSGSSGKLFVGSNASGLTTTQLDRIFFLNGSTYYPATILSTGEVVPTSSTVIVSAQTGDWGTGSTWVGGIAPSATDEVRIISDHTVDVNGSYTCAKLDLGDNVSHSSLTFSGTNPSLTVNGPVFIGSATNQNFVGRVTLSAGATLTCSSMTIGTNRTGSTGNVNVLQMGTGGILTTGSITVDNTFGITNPLWDPFWNPGLGTVVMTGTSTLPATIFTTFYNLTIDGGTTTSSSAALTVNNDLTVQQGAMVLSATDADYLFVNVIVQANGTLTHSVPWDNAPNRKIGISGNLDVTGIFNPTVRSHVNMYGTGSKTIRTGDNASSILSILTFSDGNYTANGTLKTNQEVWAMFGTAGSFSTAGNNVTFSSMNNFNGTVNVNGGSLTVNSNCEIGYSGTSGVMNLSSGSFNVIGDLIINGAAALNCTNSPAINIAGNWTNNGSFTPASSTVTFNGTLAQSIGGTYNTAFYNLAISNTGAAVTFGASTAISNNLSIASNAVANLGTGLSHTTVTLTMGGAGRINGTWGHSSSSATYENDIYFADATGIVTIGTSSCTAPTFGYSKTEVSCYGGSDGSITVTVTGGIPNYEFSKDGGTNWTAPQASNQYTFSGLTAAGGPYDIAVRDGSGCVQTTCP